MDKSVLTELDPRRARAITELAEASANNNFGYTTWTFFPPKPNTYLNDEVEKVWGGTITSKKYLQDIQKLFEEDKAAGNIIPVPAR
ncbi:MAG: hypothetical protein IMZ61_05735 [Planctomycetes bacterium]|nr:hypothetical protein [Planctomycetota bacterium]